MVHFVFHLWEYPVAWALAVPLSVWAMIHAILKRRDHRAASWWTALVWLIPFLGPLLYYIFGINRIERKAAWLRQKTPAPEPVISPHLTKKEVDSVRPLPLTHLETLAKLVDKVVDLPLTSGNRVTPLIDGDEAFPEMLHAITHANKSIGLSTYIFDHDETGQTFIRALRDAAKRGVSIRVLIDDVGAGFLWSKVFRELKNAGISVAYFMPSLAPWRVAYVNLRSHRKIITVDGNVGFTGGMNITDNHVLKRKHPHAASDLHFKIEGPAVAQLQDAFRTDWHFTTGEELAGDKWFPTLFSAGKTLARGIADGPDEDFEKCRWTLLSAISHARKSIQIMTPYFIPDSAIITALNLAAMSGVNVDIVLPRENDMVLVKWATQALLWQVLERGCRVWMTPAPFNHTKLMIVDGGWSFFGSTNWDQRSLRLNFEFNVECYDASLASNLSKLIDEKISKSDEISLQDVDSRPFLTRLRDGTARLLSPLL